MTSQVSRAWLSCVTGVGKAKRRHSTIEGAELPQIQPVEEFTPEDRIPRGQGFKTGSEEPGSTCAWASTDTEQEGQDSETPADLSLLTVETTYWVPCLLEPSLLLSGSRPRQRLL